MLRAREEGFELPAAESELKAFHQLQRLVRSATGTVRAADHGHFSGVIAWIARRMGAF